MRLIDADKAKEWFSGGRTYLYADDVLNRINHCPTIDAVPVAHGTWQLNKDGSGTCDQCHFTQRNVWDMDNWQNFCGVCGADMRSE